VGSGVGGASVVIDVVGAGVGSSIAVEEHLRCDDFNW